LRHGVGLVLIVIDAR